MSKVKIKPRYVKPPPKPKKSTALVIARIIFIVLACALLLAGIAERIWHVYNSHFKH